MADNFVIPPPVQAAVPVRGGGLFPVRRIFCVGRNYAEHAREMGHDPNREPPFFFTKPADAVLSGGKDMPYPPATADLHHEFELVVALSGGGADVAEADALGLVLGEAKKLGRPWDMAKGFDASAPISEIVPASVCGHPAKGRITLSVNGAMRQDSDIAKMIWNVPETIAALSRLVTLAPGDLIFTGTPEGVAATVRGDVLEGSIEGVAVLKTRLV